jgi:hypothetical protein
MGRIRKRETREKRRAGIRARSDGKYHLTPSRPCRKDIQAFPVPGVQNKRSKAEGHPQSKRQRSIASPCYSPDVIAFFRSHVRGGFLFMQGRQGNAQGSGKIRRVRAQSLEKSQQDRLGPKVRHQEILCLGRPGDPSKHSGLVYFRRRYCRSYFKNNPQLSFD